MLYKRKGLKTMKIKSIANNYSTQKQNNQKNNKTAFGNFIVVTIPKEQIKAVSGPWHKDVFGTKYRQELETRAEEIVESVKALTKGRIKIYCRDLNTIRFSSGNGVKKYNLDFSPLQIRSWLTGVFDECLRTLYLNDSHGKNKLALEEAHNNLVSKKHLQPKLWFRDLFADRAHSYDGILEGTNLQQHAYGAKPEDMIEL